MNTSSKIGTKPAGHQFGREAIPERAHSRKSWLLFIVLLLGVTACRNAGPAPKSEEPGRLIERTDGLGRRVGIVDHPQRIISLAPNITEILFALQLDARIVGVTSYCDHPAAATTREKVGDTINPNREKIIGLRPDLVIVSTSSQLETLTSQLDRLSIPVYVTNSTSVAEILTTIRAVGEITGTTERAEMLATEMEERIRRVEERVARLPRVRVLYLLQMDPLISAGRKTYLNDLIRLAGGQSITGEEEPDYPQFSLETVIARTPEVILLPDRHGTSVIDEQKLRRSLAITPAVRNGRLMRINPDWSDRPGPRIVEALEQFAQALHPPSP
jgi:iron complex transport system substrate-binding protein